MTPDTMVAMPTPQPIMRTILRGSFIVGCASHQLVASVARPPPIRCTGPRIEPASPGVSPKLRIR